MSEQLQEDVMYYYLRTETKINGKVCRTPYGTVALRRNEDGTVNRGISMCSTKDNFCRKTGRKIAFSNLMKVENKEVNIERKPYCGHPLFANMPFEPGLGNVFSGYYHCEPTSLEIEILK